MYNRASKVWSIYIIIIILKSSKNTRKSNEFKTYAGIVVWNSIFNWLLIRELPSTEDYTSSENSE